MFQKRRSMLGRRHLMAQQQARTAAAQAAGDGSGGSGGRGGRDTYSGRDGGTYSGGRGSCWRGKRSEKKKTPQNLDKASKDFKKCLFSKSPGFTSLYNTASQERNYYSSYDNLNETGVSMIAPTPKSTPRIAITPMTLQQRRIQLEKNRYGPSSSAGSFSLTTSARQPDKSTATLRSAISPQTSYMCDFDNLKPPDSPPPSRLERLLLEEQLAQNPSSSDFYNLKPPDSPGPSRLDKLIMEEKLEQPLDPELKKIQGLSLEDPNRLLQFSPPLSSTCIGSPDSGQKNTKVKDTVVGSGKKLSVINEDFDLSIIEFEQNERTIQELDSTLTEVTMNNTVKPRLENIPENENDDCVDKSELNLENLLTHLDKMERDVMDSAQNHVSEIQILKEGLETLQKNMETIQKNIEKESLEHISSIRLVKKTLESFKQPTSVVSETENKENDFSFRVPTCKKKQLDEESKWFNSVKKENPSLLKTPNPSRKMNQSTTLTPHSLSNVLHDQMNKLYN